MTTCNDSFYYGLLNPQIQLCPSRPSASRLFSRIFPPALLSVEHLGSCGHTVGVGCMSGSHPWPWEGQEHQGSPGKGRKECTEGFARDGEMPLFFLHGLFLPEKLQISLSPNIITNILSQPEGIRRHGYGNSLWTQLLLGDVASLCSNHAWCPSFLEPCQL